MMPTTVESGGPGRRAFRHEAYLYAGAQEFVDGISAFVRDGLEADQPVLVATDAVKIDLLRSELGGDAARVRFEDMSVVGRNPGRIISVWRDWLDEQVEAGHQARGVGEPVWHGRSPAELVECQYHENLLNLAFRDSVSWTLRCPYDTSTLSGEVVEEAQHSHPWVLAHAASESAQPQNGHLGSYLRAALPAAPTPPTEEFAFGAGDLPGLRSLVSRYAACLKLPPGRIDDLVLAVNEVATNSLRYGGGQGVLGLWEHEGALVCQVSDRGVIDTPLIGRLRPPADRVGGRGLWLANQLCDLVQVRSSPEDGTIVRLHFLLSDRAAERTG